MKYLILLISAFILLNSSSQAFELDWSADDEIRKNYDSSKLENEILPELPPVLKNTPQSETTAKPVQQSSNSSSTGVPKSNIDVEFSSNYEKNLKKLSGINGSDSYSTIKIPRGTKFKVKSQTKLSDWNTAGARATFVSTEPVTKRYITIPAGTVFKGVIEDSHQPNFAGNGGLLKLKSDMIVLDGNSRNINAKVVRANDKKIFLNNIKGKRGYLKGIAVNVDKGQQFYNKSRNTSAKLSQNPVGTIISPIPTVVGAAGYCANLVVSPITALWSKGAHISLPAGTQYTIKFKQDLLIYK